MFDCHLRCSGLAVAFCRFASGCRPETVAVSPAREAGSTAASTRDRNETLERIYGIVAEQMNVERPTLTPETSLAALQMDELDIYETVMWTEEEFGVRISDDDGETSLDGKATLSDLADLVDRARGRSVR